MVTCGSCGSTNHPGARFCSECGAKLEVTPAREERKICTIVFCDLVGFTQRSESLDPEDVRQFLLPYYDLMEEEITRFGGTIDKLYGDGAMAVFGTPVAHEDDPERAIRASLSVLARLPDLRLDLKARIGISTGEVVVSTDHAQRGDALTGDTVNTASRIESAAPVGGVVVGEATHRATAHIFDYETLEPVELKGKAGKVPIFRPITPHGVIGEDLSPDVTPFVGREAELSHLIQVFEAARAGETTFLTIVAEPGMGKSRLVREFSRYVDDAPELITWRQGRCLPYGEAISFWALTEIVKSHAGILDTDGQPVIQEKLERVLADPDPSTRRWLKDRLAPLVGLETTSEAPQPRELYTAWRRFLELVASAGPTVLVIEDLHWADDALVEFLASARSAISGLPLLVLVTARPEVHQRHPTWVEADSSISLSSLGSAAMRELVTTALDVASIDLVGAVVERAGGSPLYAEQFAAMRRSMPIAGGGSDDLPIPPSIQALLAARIDMLSEDLRTALQDASVIGKTFWTGAVSALAELDPGVAAGYLDDLASRRFIRSVTDSTIPEERAFSFEHALVRDVAYAALSRRSRIDKHRAAARWIRDTVGEPLGELAGIVVSHLDRARDAAAAADRHDEVAAIDHDLVDPLLDAAANARTIDLVEAVDRLERVLPLMGDHDARRTATVASLALWAATSGDFKRAAPMSEEAIRQARAVGDIGAYAKAIEASVMCQQGTDEDSLPTLDRAIAEFRLHPPSPGLLFLLSNRAWFAAAYGEPGGASSWIEETKQTADAAGLPLPAKLLEAEGTMLMDQGDPSGEAVMREAARMYLEEGAIGDAAWVRNDIAVNIVGSSGYRTALEQLVAVRTFAQERGIDPSIGLDYYLQWKYELGSWEEILSEAPELLEQMTALGSDHAVGAITESLTSIYVDRGGRWLDLIDASFLGQPGRVHAALRMRLTGSVAPGDLAPLETAIAAGGVIRPSLLELDSLIRVGRFDLASSIVERWPVRFATQGHVVRAGQAMIAAASGIPREAREKLREAIEEAEHLDARQREASLSVYLGRCARRLGDQDGARSSLERARTLYVEMGADARITEVDRLLEQSDV